MEQTGPLVSPAVLPKLSDAQLKRLQMAKKYCLDVSTKFVSGVLGHRLGYQDWLRVFYLVHTMSMKPQTAGVLFSAHQAM